MNRPLVVAICAVPGAGKSTLIHSLKARWRCASLAQDDFAPATRFGYDEIKTWFAQGGSYAAFDMSPFVAAAHHVLDREPNAPLLLLETHFGRDHPAQAPMIGRQIWIDVPLDIALAPLGSGAERADASRKCRSLAETLSRLLRRRPARNVRTPTHVHAAELGCRDRRSPPPAAVADAASAYIRRQLDTAR